MGYIYILVFCTVRIGENFMEDSHVTVKTCVCLEIRIQNTWKWGSEVASLPLESLPREFQVLFKAFLYKVISFHMTIYPRQSIQGNFYKASSTRHFCVCEHIYHITCYQQMWTRESREVWIYTTKTIKLVFVNTIIHTTISTSILQVEWICKGMDMLALVMLALALLALALALIILALALLLAHYYLLNLASWFEVVEELELAIALHLVVD